MKVKYEGKSKRLSDENLSLIFEMQLEPNKNWEKKFHSLDLSRYLFNITKTTRATTKSLNLDVKEGLYGKPVDSKIDWVRSLKHIAQNKINVGASHNTVIRFIKDVKAFHDWIYSCEGSYKPSKQRKNYFLYSQHLASRVIEGEIKEISRYDKLLNISSFIDSFTGLADEKSYCKGVFYELSLRCPKTNVKKYDKQLLVEIKEMASALMQLYSSIDEESIFGQLPIEARINNKKFYINFSAAYSVDKLKKSAKRSRLRFENISGRQFLSPSESLVHDKRWAIVNLKRNAFFMMFIIATGANLSQAISITNQETKTLPSGADQTIFKFKLRAGHEVGVNIYNNFKELFNNYKRWRDSIFVGEYESEWLFPTFDLSGQVAKFPGNNLSRLRKILMDSGVSWHSSRELRRTNINWMYRFLEDSKEAAAMAGHDLATFYRSYMAPNHQRAVMESQQFWTEFDVTKLSVMGGYCDGEPIPIKDISPVLAVPNCTTASGCLVCQHHKDVDSYDYIWSLASFRYLKQLESASSHLSKLSSTLEPADVIINQITSRLETFKVKRPDWVIAAIDRVELFDFHPQWVNAIDMLVGFEV
ncbi:hypothetical protein [Salinimonas chungwhensis]|uniref:hypothetical protein n=1 Tax=Salinimonas chungwhensis TaxID=265425 RepID=UPI0003604CEE|nr:hypothetical protein [Salinimonas chungwhensis]